MTKINWNFFAQKFFFISKIVILNIFLNNPQLIIFGAFKSQSQIHISLSFFKLWDSQKKTLYIAQHVHVLYARMKISRTHHQHFFNESWMRNWSGLFWRINSVTNIVSSMTSVNNAFTLIMQRTVNKCYHVAITSLEISRSSADCLSAAITNCNLL